MLKIPKMPVRILIFCGLFSASFPSVSMEEQSTTPTSTVQKILPTSRHKKAILDLQSPVPTTALGKQKKSAFGTSELASVCKRRPQKKQKESLLSQRPSVSVTEWPTSLLDLSSEDLRYLYGHCSRMVEYEDLMLESNTWTRRLQCVESAQRTLEIPDSKVQPIGSKLSDGYEPYQIRHIYINTKNPSSSLDLHGIVSAQAAKTKVLQFINVAKSKKKKQVTVITGKGNHVNGRGSRGVLLQSFPKWVEKNPSIVKFSKRVDGGSYVVYLTPSSRIRIDFDPLHDLQQKIFYPENYEGCCFDKITVWEGNHHFKNNPDSGQESIDSGKSKSSSRKTKKLRGKDYLKDFPSASQMRQHLPRECVAVSIPKRRLLKTAQPLPAQQKIDYTLSRYPEETRDYNEKKRDKASRSKSKINLSKTSSSSKKSPSLAIPKAISVFPTVISHKKAKEYLEQFCQIQQQEPPYYELVSHANPNIKIVAVTIEGFGTHQVETDKKPQQFIAQEVYQKITGVSASRKKAKELLEKICQEKGYGVPAYQTLSREFRVKVSVGNLTEEASHTSQDYAEKLAAKKMHELLKNSSKTK